MTNEELMDKAIESTQCMFMNIFFKPFGLKLIYELGRCECLYCGASWSIVDDGDDGDDPMTCACTRSGNWNPNVDVEHTMHNELYIVPIRGSDYCHMCGGYHWEYLSCQCVTYP